MVGSDLPRHFSKGMGGGVIKFFFNINLTEKKLYVIKNNKHFDLYTINNW